MRDLLLGIVLATLIALSIPVHASVRDSVGSVVSVLPIRPGSPQSGPHRRPGTVPEGSGVAIGDEGFVATAWHVVRSATRIDVRLADGRILPARLVGYDEASDVALLKIATSLSGLQSASQTTLAQRVCAISNAYGLGLSVTCGVVSALNVSNAGFNAVEDFIQTDAAANPGSSGGALVDSEGRLIGMISAIFAAKADTNIGVNFAVSDQLLRRVVSDLRQYGRVRYVSAGWRLSRLSRPQLARVVAARVRSVAENGVAAAAGIKVGDLIITIGPRRIKNPKDVVSALALVEPGASVDVVYQREGRKNNASLAFPLPSKSASKDPEPKGVAPHDCPHPKPVCAVRQAVFPIESFNPVASAVRIGERLLVTNRHAVGARTQAKVYTPDGTRMARVLPSTYRGDLALLEVAGLPADGLILAPPAATATPLRSKQYYAVGADIARKKIRVFEPGSLILAPAKAAPFGRIHVTAKMQPGVSGGALVTEVGELVGIAVGGGEGRNEALPLKSVSELLNGRMKPGAVELSEQLGKALEVCAAAIDKAKRFRRGKRPDQVVISALKSACREAGNAGLYLKAARYLAFARQYDDAIELSRAAVEQVPHSANARLSYLVALQLAGRFEQMLPHAAWLLKIQPNDPQSLRFAIQSGVWAGDKALAEAAYGRLRIADPRQAQAARRFIDRPPPTPRRR